ncbi:MAG: hypothetical protein LQ340_005784 [Diploschistes diacapsis]|nr:MAG: hypothetical protein LQ340_005784 [Diploschistes diacapsis]
MSEYWKSTPSYWCKHCSKYVRDTPLEKKNHEATPRHQGNLKRFIRDLHRDNERTARDKQRAKDEVARLNGDAPTPGGSGQFKSSVTFQKEITRNAPADERKRQLAQLAQMGVAVPEDYRRENAMAGDWQVVSQRVIAPDRDGIKAEGDEDVKQDLNIGIRKRKAEDETEEPVPKLEEGRRRPKYGTSMRALPAEDDDLDALLRSTSSITKKTKTEIKSEVEPETATVAIGRPTEPDTGLVKEPAVESPEEPTIKSEDPSQPLIAEASASGPEIAPKAKDGNEDVGTIFKKRKAKVLRQK